MKVFSGLTPTPNLACDATAAQKVLRKKSNFLWLKYKQVLTTFQRLEKALCTHFLLTII